MHEKELLTANYPQESVEEEIQRLKVQSLTFGTSTRRLFEQAGITQGMKVLHVGGGVGDVSMLLADLVGPYGAVIVIESNATMIEIARKRVQDAGYSHVTFLQGESETVQPGTDFDAIAGCNILALLPDPDYKLYKLVHFLRPGGIVVFQEVEMERFNAQPTYPSCQLYEQICFNVLEAYYHTGLPVRMGASLHGVFLDAGLPAPHISCEGIIGSGAAWKGYEYLAGITRMLLPLILKFGIATEEEIAIETLAKRLRAEVVSQRAIARGPDLISAWTHKL